MQQRSVLSLAGPAAPWLSNAISPAQPQGPILSRPVRSSSSMCPGWGGETAGLPRPWGSTSSRCWDWGAGSSAGSSECLCVYMGMDGGDRKTVPPRLLFPADEVTGLQRLSSAEGESVPALPRCRARPPRPPPCPMLTWQRCRARRPSSAGFRLCSNVVSGPPAPLRLRCRMPPGLSFPLHGPTATSSRQHRGAAFQSHLSIRPQRPHVPTVRTSLPAPRGAPARGHNVLFV